MTQSQADSVNVSRLVLYDPCKAIIDFNDNLFVFSLIIIGEEVSFV